MGDKIRQAPSGNEAHGYFGRPHGRDDNGVIMTEMELLEAEVLALRILIGSLSLALIDALGKGLTDQAAAYAMAILDSVEHMTFEGALKSLDDVVDEEKKGDGRNNGGQQN